MRNGRTKVGKFEISREEIFQAINDYIEIEYGFVPTMISLSLYGGKVSGAVIEHDIKKIGE